jgi:hypothetical protein
LENTTVTGGQTTETIMYYHQAIMSSSPSEKDLLKCEVGKRAKAFVKFLYPRGKCVGDHWRIGNEDGAPGQSLAISLTGQYAGVGYDFNTEETIDCIGMWMAARAVDFPTAVREIAEWLAGIRFNPLPPQTHVTLAPASILVTEPPTQVTRDFNEGVFALKSSPQWQGIIANWRGWPIPFVSSICAAGIVGTPMLDGESRGVAFPVHAPFKTECKAAFRFIGFHQRLAQKPAWIYRPYPRRDGASIPSLPFVLGDFFQAHHLIIAEGQWDALTLVLSMGWYGPHGLSIPPGVAVIGVRGATSTAVFFRHYAEFWPANAKALVLPQNDDAGKKWHHVASGHMSFCQHLNNLCRGVEVLVLTDVNDWNDALRSSPQEITRACLAIQKLITGVEA